MKLAIGDRYRRRLWSNRDLKRLTKQVEDIRTLADIEAFRTLLKRRKWRLKPIKHPMLQQITVASIKHVFEFGDERTYMLETLATQRPKFLIKKVLNKTIGPYKKLYKLTEETEEKVSKLVKESSYFRKLIDLESIRIIVEKLPHREGNELSRKEAIHRYKFSRAYDFWAKIETELLVELKSNSIETISRILQRLPEEIEKQLERSELAQNRK